MARTSWAPPALPMHSPQFQQGQFQLNAEPRGDRWEGVATHFPKCLEAEGHCVGPQC